LIEAPFGQEVLAEQGRFWQQLQQGRQHQGDQQAAKGAQQQQPGAVGEGGPGGQQHDRVEHRRCK
jgi:hypothetical protein